MVPLRPHLAPTLTAPPLTTHPAAEPQPYRCRPGRLPDGIRLSIALLCLGAVGVLATSAAPGPGAPPVVGQWLAAQTNLQTWTATVRQIRSFKSMAQPLQETGRVWFAAPNRFRWEIGTPAKTIAVREPDQMLVIYPRLKRAERFPLTGSEAGPWRDTLALLEAGFPRSAADLEARFKVLSSTATNGTWELGLQPRAASARRLMPLLKVAFAESDFRLQVTELRFADGSLMRNEFSDASVNPPLDPGVFQPVLEPDIQIVEPLARRKP